MIVALRCRRRQRVKAKTISRFYVPSPPPPPPPPGTSQTMASSEDLSDGLVCGVCCEQYEAGPLDPLTLPCGHTFCRSCLTNVEKTQGLSCPTCRSECTGKVANFPPNYAMLSLLEALSFNVEQCDQCHIHPGHDLNYWCWLCKTLICGLCISQNHRQEKHVIESQSSARKAKKSTVYVAADQKKTDVEDMLEDGMKKAILELLHLTQKATGWVRTSKVLKGMIDVLDTKPKPNMDVLMDLEEKVKGITIPKLPVRSLLSSSYTSEFPLQERSASSVESSFQRLSTRSYSSLVIRSRKYERSLLEEDQEDTLAQTFPDSIGSREKKESICGVRCGENMYGLMVGEGDRIFLHSFSSRVPQTHFSITWHFLAPCIPVSTLVFMELSTSDGKIGTFTIRIFHHLRRAIHFLGICLGIWGSSFKNTPLNKVYESQYCKFLISGGHHCESTGLTSTAGLMPQLEWDGDFSGKDHVGQVVSFGGGHVHMDAVFGICVSEIAKGGRSRCPFGEVVEGLEVVEKATTLAEASKSVIITSCGIVLNVNQGMDEACEGSLLQ